ncbi:MBL fold metallo-hydrolase [Candidatus Desantisbacteria bacterium]|nr:MBL fold metallo-hydrolase [Candidatus Desantisbacteria bacterium]
MSIYPLKYEIIFDQQKDIIKKIAPNVFLSWQQKKGASYIIKIHSGAVLIDSTGDSAAKIVIEALKQINLRPKDVKLIFNTHYHFEQIAGNDAFPDARIYAQQKEIPFISGEKKGKQKPSFGNFIFAPYTKKSINDLLDNTKLTFEDFCLYIIHTPGHTEGSASYLYNDILFTGDLIEYKENKVFLSSFWDSHSALDSIKRLQVLDFEYLCLGDGHVLREGRNIIKYLSSHPHGHKV